MFIAGPDSIETSACITLITQRGISVEYNWEKDGSAVNYTQNDEDAGNSRCLIVTEIWECFLPMGCCDFRDAFVFAVAYKKSN